MPSRAQGLDSVDILSAALATLEDDNPPDVSSIPVERHPPFYQRPFFELTTESDMQDIMSTLPTDEGGDLMSTGSKGHEAGECRPCAFFHDDRKGCSRGVFCDFCHFPHPKKKRVKLSRLQRMERRAEKQREAAEAEYLARTLGEGVLDHDESEEPDNDIPAISVMRASIRSLGSPKPQKQAPEVGVDEIKIPPRDQLIPDFVQPALEFQELMKNLPTDKSSNVMSLGSLNHDLDCKPCAFYHDDRKGCTRGIFCEFCHFAHPKKKRIKPSKRQRMERRAAREVEEALLNEVGIMPFPAPFSDTSSFSRGLSPRPDHDQSSQSSVSSPPGVGIPPLDFMYPMSSLCPPSLLGTFSGWPSLVSDGTLRVRNTFLDVPHAGGEKALSPSRRHTVDLSPMGMAAAEAVTPRFRV